MVDRIIRTILLTGCLIASGCSPDSVTGVPAEGTVMADGIAISGALITLEPISPTTGPKSSAPVFNGQFKFAPERGLHGGDYRVRFSLMPAEVRSKLPSEHAAGLPAKDAVIGAEFDFNSQLTWKLSTDQANQRNFEIELR